MQTLAWEPWRELWALGEERKKCSKYKHHLDTILKELWDLSDLNLTPILNFHWSIWLNWAFNYPEDTFLHHGLGWQRWGWRKWGNVKIFIPQIHYLGQVCSLGRILAILVTIYKSFHWTIIYTPKNILIKCITWYTFRNQAHPCNQHLDKKRNTKKTSIFSPLGPHTYIHTLLVITHLALPSG